MLNVIPITSVSNKYNINLGNIIYDENKVNNLKTLLENETDKELKRNINVCLTYYKKYKNIISYACIKHIKTISKLIIINPINKYDYLNEIIVPDSFLNEIDKSIIKEYTNYKL